MNPFLFSCLFSLVSALKLVLFSRYSLCSEFILNSFRGVESSESETFHLVSFLFMLADHGNSTACPGN